jgi:hypothetical protein
MLFTLCSLIVNAPRTVQLIENKVCTIENIEDDIKVENSLVWSARGVGVLQEGVEDH